MTHTQTARLLPGQQREPRDTNPLHAMLRVNHAGEYGAKRIYQGQLAATTDPHTRSLLTHMAEQEEEHLRFFDNALQEQRVRPTVLHPLWHVGAFLLGYTTAKLGPTAAMTCTVAVETVIDNHYEEQLTQLKKDTTDQLTKDLIEAISRFQAEELEHKQIGLDEGAAQYKHHDTLSRLIRGITQTAITLSKRY